MLFGLLLLVLGDASAAPAPSDPIDPPATETPTAEPIPIPTPAPRPDPCQSTPPDRASSFDAELERAKTLYRRGCHAWALTLLQDLDVRRRLSPIEPAFEIDQRLYLAEVLLVLGRSDDATDVFELLLTDHPTTEMGLLEHDPDAVDLLERVRGELLARAPVVPPDLPPLRRRPLWTYAPYGVGHVATKDTRSGLMFGGVQAAFIGTMVVTSAMFPREWKTLRIPKEGDPQNFNRIVALRTVNYSAFAGFWVTYAISQAKLSREWRRKERARLQISPTGASIQGRF